MSNPTLEDFVRGSEATITDFVERHPNMIGVVQNAISYAMTADFIRPVRDQVALNQAFSLAFSANTVFQCMYSQEKCQRIVDAIGQSVVLEAMLDLVTLGRSWLGRVGEEEFAQNMRAQTDLYLMATYAKQMRAPEAHLQELANWLIDNEEYRRQAVASVLQNHQPVVVTLH